MWRQLQNLKAIDRWTRERSETRTSCHSKCLRPEEDIPDDDDDDEADDGQEEKKWKTRG